MTSKITTSCNFILLAISMAIIGGCQKSESNTPLTPDSSEANTTDQAPSTDAQFNLEKYLNSDIGIADAWNLVKEEITPQLKAPSTATYTPIEQMIEYGRNQNLPTFQLEYSIFRSSFFTGGLGESKSGIKWIPEKTSYYIIGFVDSQNSYGAMLRAYIAAKIFLENSASASNSAKSSEDLVWTVQDLKMSQ